ncbi:MAG: polysaccharide biosynthesis/export family protein [Gammaproteobacteria bacterium]|nr:polysaccharide biosynthesis/export family protein [Gammaproteobacteria bacterium]
MRRTLQTLMVVVLCVLQACARPSGPRPPDEPSTAPAIELEEGVKVGKTDEERTNELARLRALPPQTFRLGKGDVLAVSVYNEPDLRLDGLAVRPDGMLSFPLVGDVMAEGRTVDELRTELTTRLSEFVQKPRVSVIVQQVVSHEYTIVGEVVRPGVFALDRNVSLTKAIARSGGLKQGQFRASSAELADLKNAFVSRDGNVLPVDFVALLRHGDLRHDIPLAPGDYIFIPSGLSKEIYILGEVNRPDLFAYRDDLQLSRALVMAQGFNADAELSRIHVIRGSLSDPTLYIVDLQAVFDGRERDVKLAPGDIVFVPPTGLTEWARITQRLIPNIQMLQTMLLLSR